jgi:hypothetical protein
VGLHIGRNEVRTFLLDRMRDTEVSATERFELPPDFKIDDHFQGQFGIWRGTQSIKVVVDFDARVADLVRSRKVHTTQKIASLPDGSLRLSMVVGELTEVISWVLGFGETARVIEPPDLVERVKGELQQALANYSKPRPAGPIPSAATTRAAGIPDDEDGHDEDAPDEDAEEPEDEDDEDDEPDDEDDEDVAGVGS